MGTVRVRCLWQLIRSSGAGRSSLLLRGCCLPSLPPHTGFFMLRDVTAATSQLLSLECADEKEEHSRPWGFGGRECLPLSSQTPKEGFCWPKMGHLSGAEPVCSVQVVSSEVPARTTQGAHSGSSSVLGRANCYFPWLIQLGGCGDFCWVGVFLNLSGWPQSGGFWKSWGPAVRPLRPAQWHPLSGEERWSSFPSGPWVPGRTSCHPTAMMVSKLE